MYFLIIFQTVTHHGECAVWSARFLFDQVVLDSAFGFDRVEDLFPGGVAFAERDRVGLSGRPVLTMDALDASGIGVDPGDWVGAHFDTGAYVELQDDLLRRAGANDIHRPLSVDRPPFHLMVVIPGCHLERLQLL